MPKRKSAQCSERGIGLEACAHRADFGDAARELLRQQADDDVQDVVSEPRPAFDPAHRARELDRVDAAVSAPEAVAFRSRGSLACAANWTACPAAPHKSGRSESCLRMSREMTISHRPTAEDGAAMLADLDRAMAAGGAARDAARRARRRSHGGGRPV